MHIARLNNAPFLTDRLSESNIKIFIFLESIMNQDHSGHQHHHQVNIVANTTVAMNHDHHMMQNQMNTNSARNGQGYHGDMMMMGVSISIMIDRKMTPS
jgi:hypothetical protein